MTEKHRPSFSPEFKLEAAQLVTEKGYSTREAAEVMGVSHSAMRTWVKQLRSDTNQIKDVI